MHLLPKAPWTGIELREENKLGLRGSVTGEVIYKDLAVPAKNMLSKSGDGVKIALSTISGVGRPGIASISVRFYRPAWNNRLNLPRKNTLWPPIDQITGDQFMIADNRLEYDC